MKKYHYLLIGPLFLTFIQIESNPIISFFFQPLSDVEKIMGKLKKPGYLAKREIYGAVTHHSPVMGILATYAGYITASDYHGEVIFPRKHQRPAVTIIVTQEMMPVSLFENTIDHWELIPGSPAAMYLFEQKYDDKQEYHYWESQEVSVPLNYKIPLEAIIIIAKPKNIVIPSGITKTRETANLVLPTLFITKGINIVTNNIYMLTIRHLFKPVDLKEKREQLHIRTYVID